MDGLAKPGMTGVRNQMHERFELLLDFSESANPLVNMKDTIQGFVSGFCGTRGNHGDGSGG